MGDGCPAFAGFPHGDTGTAITGLKGSPITAYRADAHNSELNGYSDVLGT